MYLELVCMHVVWCGRGVALLLTQQSGVKPIWTCPIAPPPPLQRLLRRRHAKLWLQGYLLLCLFKCYNFLRQRTVESFGHEYPL